MNRQNLYGLNVLVTGGAGFIGSHLADRLLSCGVRELVLIDNLFLGTEHNITNAIENGAIFYHEDIENLSSLEYIFENHDIDVVFNLATKALNYSFVNPSNSYTTNINGVINLLELQRKKKFKTLCPFSTSEVYGSAVYEPMDEKHPISPTTTYAAGKASADLALESYVKMFQLDAFIVRPFNNYGPRQNYKGYLAGLIPISAKRILENSCPELHGDGAQKRDFIFVMDTVEAVLKLYGVLPAGESVNISTDNCFSVKEILSEIISYYDYSGELLKKIARDSDVQTHNSCNKKLNSLISCQYTPLHKGLAETLEWYRNHINNE